MRVSVLLTRQEIDALGRLALVERRRPSDQAAFLIGEILKHKGLLSDSDNRALTSSNTESNLNNQQEAMTNAGA
jgi:hypothetical protein